VVRALLLDRLGGLDVPVVAGAPIGHDEPNLAVPIGTTAHLSGTQLRIEVARIDE